MIKYLLYWTLYTSTLQEPSRTAGTIVVYQDSVKFYIAEAGYVTMPIVYKKEHNRDGKLLSAKYLLKKDEHFVTMEVNNSFIAYSIKIGNHKEHVKLKRLYAP